MLEVGELLDSKYRIIKQFGQGGAGTVYLAENIKLGTYWAIKEICKSPETGIDLYVEPNILKKLDHPALPRVFDIIEDESKMHIVVDYIEGKSLDTLLAEKGTFPETTVLDWAVQLCDVLDYLHNIRPNPVIYRDMKPSNIILTASGRLKLIDFGIAREYKSRAGNDTVFIGTRGYAAPEQYGKGQTSAISDIYSLGVTLHSLLTGADPSESFDIKPVRSYNRNISYDTGRIIEKCTSREPDGRYRSAAKLLEDIRAHSLNADKHTSDNGAAGNKNNPSFKKLVLTIWDNAEFGCELAYIAAKLSGHSVLLIDADLLSPKADLVLNTGKYCDRYVINGRYNNSVFDVAIDAIDKGCLTSDILYEASFKKKDAGDLNIVTGSYLLENYEYFREDHLVKLIEKAYQSFDITVVLANRSIYDSYTVISLIKSDYNIIASRPDIGTLREFNNYAVFLSEKQGVDLKKNKFVMFDYNESLSLKRELVNEVTQGNLIGSVRYSSRRARYRNIKALYANRMEKAVISDYVSLLLFFRIIPRQTVVQKFMTCLNTLSKPAVRKRRDIKGDACVKNPS